MASACETSCGVRPSARARSWSTTSFRYGDCSFQSSCASLMFGFCSHDVAHLVGDLAHLLGVRADHAELHREADRRTEIEAVDADARFRQRAVGDRLLDLRLDALARLDVLGDDHDLGEGLVRQLRVEAEPEARRALADIGRVGARCPCRPSGALSAFLHGLLGDVEGGAFRQAQSAGTARAARTAGRTAAARGRRPTIEATNTRDGRRAPS